MLFITDYFQAIKDDKDITKVLPKADSKEYYFYMKAYKLVDEQGFYAYCRRHKQSNPAFLAMLHSIIDDHYPPLEYNHQAKDGYKGLSNYIHYCKQVFNA